MNDTIPQPRISCTGRRPVGGGPSHPLDLWLRRELGKVYAAADSEPLPREMAELAARLEEALGSGPRRK